MRHECVVCHDLHDEPRAADACCRCTFCGCHTAYQPCEECYSDRHCENCLAIYDGDDIETAMRFGCDEEEGYDENTLCLECWLERQPPLTQLAGALIL
jgi:hypothetical protein